MERREKQLIAWAILACSLILIAFFPILYFAGHVNGLVLTVLCIVYFISVFAAIEYSRDGWRIEGSTFEWIISAAIAPFLALILYLVSRRQGRGERINPRDHERLEKF